MAGYQRVGLEFDGRATGAIGAARQTSAAIDQVKRSAAGTHAPLTQVERDLGKMERGALAGSGALRGLGRSVAFASAGFLGGFGLAAAVRGAFDELTNSVKVSAQVDAALRSTGGVAGVTKRDIDALAQAELRKTGADDELIKRAEAIMLTFTNVRDVQGKGNDVFRQSIVLARDMSVALGQDLNSTVVQLGKALQDPITGMTALRRVGVALDAQQRQQIKTLVEQGKLLHAQKIILGEVRTEFGGVAEKVADVAPWMRLRETLKNLSADAIRPLLPDLDRLVGKADAWATRLENDSAAQQRLRHDVEAGVGAAKDFFETADKVAGALGGWKHAIDLVIGLKLASKLAEWTGGLSRLIGAESAGGLLGADAAATGLLGKLSRLSRLGPITIAVALELIPKAPASSNPNAPSNNPLQRLLDRLPIVGGAASQAGRAADAILGALGLMPSTPSRPAKPGLQPAPGDLGLAQSLVSTAKTALGVPYRYGGAPSLSKPTDCSGLMVAVFQKNGISLPRTSQEQYAQAPIKNQVPLLPGDLVFSEGVHPGHVGLYIGNNQVLEDPHTGDHVKIVPLSMFGWNGQSARWWGGKKRTGGTGGHAKPPGTVPPPGTTNPVPQSIRFAIARADEAAAAAALTPGKADDRAAASKQRAALTEEIAFLRTKLNENLSRGRKPITIIDLLTGAESDLAGLKQGAKTSKGAGIGSIESLRNEIAADLRGLPAKLTPAEETAVKHLEQLRSKLKVGMGPKELADERAAISRWASALKDAIDQQASKAKQAAADLAQAQAAAWEQGWQNAANRVLRDFNETIVNPQLAAFDRVTSTGLQKIQDDWQAKLDAFDKETQAGLDAIAARYAAPTPAEQALQRFIDQRNADQEAQRKKQLSQQIADTQAQLAGLASSGTLIDVATGTRTPLARADIVSKTKDLQQQLLELQAQYHDLELDDQQAALQAAADASRRAADAQADADEKSYQGQRDRLRKALEDQSAVKQQSYQDDRDAQRQALQDQLDDEAAALNQSLSNWEAWLQAKKTTWADFLHWLATQGITDPGLTPPSSNVPAPPAGGAPRISTGAGGRRAVALAGGGTLGGIYIGRDSVPAFLSPGETVIDRTLTRELAAALSGGGRGGPTIIIDRPQFLAATPTQLKTELANLLEPYLGRRPQITVAR